MLSFKWHIHISIAFYQEMMYECLHDLNVRVFFNRKAGYLMLAMHQINFVLINCVAWTPHTLGLPGKSIWSNSPHCYIHPSFQACFFHMPALSSICFMSQKMHKEFIDSLSLYDAVSGHFRAQFRQSNYDEKWQNTSGIPPHTSQCLGVWNATPVVIFSHEGLTQI